MSLKILLLMIFLFPKLTMTQNQIILTLNSNGTHLLFCDDNINYFNTSYMNIYKILEDNKYNINNKLILQNQTNNEICTNKIYYSAEAEYEKILIEFNNFPKNLHGLFRNSTMYTMEIIKAFQNDDNNNEIFDFSNMFQDCKYLISVDLSNFNFCNVGKFNKMFSGCINLNNFLLPKNLSLNCINFENVDFSEMFSDCSSLTSIDLSGIEFKGINNVNNMFLNCENIESIKLRGTLNLMPISGSICYTYNNIPICFNNIKIEIFPRINSLRRLNLFDLDLNLTLIDLENLKSLEECLYYEYNNNIKKCSKYIGFHYCGNCINNNTEYYCSKLIDGNIYNFFYLEEQLSIPLEKKECYWSENYNNFLSYKFVNNGEGEISYYTYIYDSCELYLTGTTECLKCNNYNEYYKIENLETYCSKLPPEENYVLDKEAKEWRKCNNRCKKCYIQSKSENHHECLICNKYYYPFKIDYINYEEGKITGFDCFSMAEVLFTYSNYYLNSDEQFEKCDISCKECQTKNICLTCNQNYYNIYGYENGTCFHNPLPKYGLISINDRTFFKPCFNLCKYCETITQSFLYQQCNECDEINYTLDLYSLNQSYCIPKDKSNSYFIKEKTKWYIEGFDDVDELKIANKDLIIEYERLLNKEAYYNISLNTSLKIVEKCPPNKPFIIYSIRQCVSSCNSSNLIENGIFMTKKLYKYNQICYDVCPYGSVKDDINNICIEINQYTSNTSLNSYLFKENNKHYILNYLSEYANNSVGIKRADDFSNFFYHQNTNYSFKLELQLPIFDFSECIEKLKIEYNLENNNIFNGIMEYNDQNNKNAKYNKNTNFVNSTSYYFFLENGTLLNYNICEGLNIKTEKKIDTNKIDIDELKKIKEEYNFFIFNESNEILNDYCIPFSLNNKDLTIYDRKLLVSKYKSPCDEGCSFQNFNYDTNYSTCLCPIKDIGDKNLLDVTLEEIKKNEYVKLLNNSNLKYLKCYKSIFKKFPNQSFNWIKYLSISILMLYIISLSLLYLKMLCKINKDEIISKFKLNNEEKINNKLNRTFNEDIMKIL